MTPNADTAAPSDDLKAAIAEGVLEIVGIYLGSLERMGDLNGLVPDNCLPLLASTVSHLELVEQILQDEVQQIDGDADA